MAVISNGKEKGIHFNPGGDPAQMKSARGLRVFSVIPGGDNSACADETPY